jgi:uncharacterized surface protein with fasciclin (FAS1) repeats
MKRSLVLALALVSALILAACGGAPSTTAPGNATPGTGAGTAATPGTGAGTAATPGTGTGTTGTVAAGTPGTGAGTSGTAVVGTPGTGAGTSGTAAAGTPGAGTSGTAAAGTPGTGTSGTAAAGTAVPGTAAPGTSGTAAPGTSGTATGGTASGNIVEVAEADGRFTTLLTALNAAGLTNTLEGAGPFTVFAPTDEAFAALPADTLNQLLADPTQLANILRYHVAQGETTAEQIESLPSITTLEGQDITVSSSGGTVTLNDGTRLVTTDIRTSNGIIHVIDQVLLPPNTSQ